MSPIIITVVMFALLMAGLLKGWNPTAWMLLLSLIFGIGWMAFTGTSVIDPSTGNILVDAFELIQNSAIAQFTNAIFVIGI